ncbi:hypothetical protein D3C76_135170 [compost metagenome]
MGGMEEGQRKRRKRWGRWNDHRPHRQSHRRRTIRRRNPDDAEERRIPSAACKAQGDPESGRQNATAGNSGDSGQSRANGDENRDRANLRSRLQGLLIRIQTEAQPARGDQAYPPSCEERRQLGGRHRHSRLL